jgi:signal transduction histidine kinase
VSSNCSSKPGAGRFGRSGRALARFARHCIALLEIPQPEAEQMLRRITLERNVFLPIKVAWIAMLFYSFHSVRPWFGSVLGYLEVSLDTTRHLFWVYVAANVVVAAVLLDLRRLPLSLVQWVVFASCLLDGMILAALVAVTGGYQSVLYWLFLGLIVRCAVSVPRATSQVALNLTIIASYMLAGTINISIARSVNEQARAEAAILGTQRHTTTNRSRTPGSSNHVAMARSNDAVGLALTNLLSRADFPVAARLEEPPLETLGLGETSENQAEPMVVRLVLLLLMTICAYGVQVLFERQRQAVEEASEFAMREGQLRSAGRLAAEFAHRLKNPLAIINTAAFSLQRALQEGRGGADAQVRMIQEEIEHADRIITDVMGYAQLSEGHVERLNVIEELERAIARVFPAAANFPIRIQRDYATGCPPLLMVRRHAAESFTNVLQNAREALDGKGGNLLVRVRCPGGRAIEVVIGDDGPGIPAEKLGKVFEAYYTTKEKGTGLGLATVKHNLELYGGAVRAESELGKGARFILTFPVKTMT